MNIINRIARAILCGAVLASTAACATVTRGSHDTWSVQTEPSGAAVRTTNQFACDSTPCTFKMERKAEFDVTITKPGYKSWTGHVTHHVAGAGGAGMAGNVLLGGIIGAGVDVATGAMYDLVPNPLSVKLETEGKANGAP
ncbi:MAG: translation initiation factor 2, gamma subunit, GTPase [Phenylobacterium sp.]|nr:translation initiation factor 2, gamma subunit, GTPase [Phenylobacterium sp.]MDB5467283.1 translation initiation factor 2, gamma subunit, GTPase [Phenylobacterium sp.]